MLQDLHWHRAVISEDGAYCSFLDSGVPKANPTSYLTVVIYHGAVGNAGLSLPFLPFNINKRTDETYATAGTYVKVLNLAKSSGSNIRVLAVNRRDYFGCTSYTNEQVSDLHEGRKDALKLFAEDVANFLAWVIDNLDPCLPYSKLVFENDQNGVTTAKSGSGGIALMGTSIGTATTLSLLGQPGAVSNERYDKIGRYLRKVLIYGEPNPLPI
jgi:hypothetical protein